MKKFVFVAAKQLPVADVTRQELYRLLKIRNERVEGMPEGHYFLGTGKVKVRDPQQTEINLLTASGKIINPERQINVHKEADIHGTKFKIFDGKRRKTCDYIVSSRNLEFFKILRIISYTYHGVTIAGIIGKCLRYNEDSYDVTHMKCLSETEETRFISYEDIKSPGFFLPSTRELAAVSLSNIWETD